jgi:acyl carrier protein
MSAREQVREYLARVLRETANDTDPIGDDDSLVVSGRLSSVDVVDVITFLESNFDFRMDPNGFHQAKFDTVNSIVAMLEKQGAAR